jgi:NADH dehydrogenase [ubiquinone] 1 alpha subcomplex assembly factor 7
MNLNKNKILSLDKYIDEALYNKKSGYYMNVNPFGKKGDFITAPNISILFSEMIAIWIILLWKDLKSPKKFNLVELGAGNGEMVFQILKIFEKFPLIKKSCKVNILEKSIYLKKIQKKRLNGLNINWIKDLSFISNSPTIFVANEFFDALPIKQLVKKGNNWYEKNIKYSKSNIPTFYDKIIDIKKLEKKIGFEISNGQKFIEFSPLSVKYLKLISKIIKNKNGGLLIIDYGYTDKKMKDTLKSISKHKMGNVLENFGKSDISYDINFKLIEKIVKKFGLKVNGITSQKKFLQELGILERAEIVSKNLPFSKKANIYFRVKKLIDEKEMGKLFKVMFISNKNIKFKTGFNN